MIVLLSGCYAKERDEALKRASAAETEVGLLRARVSALEKQSADLSMMDRNLFASAADAEKAGDLERADAMFGDVQSKYPTSPLAVEATKHRESIAAKRDALLKEAKAKAVAEQKARFAAERQQRKARATRQEVASEIETTLAIGHPGDRVHVKARGDDGTILSMDDAQCDEGLLRRILGTDRYSDDPPEKAFKNKLVKWGFTRIECYSRFDEDTDPIGIDLP